MPATWPCPSCGRRVPAMLGECRCGAPRPAASQLLRMSGRRAKLPKDVVALLVLLVLVLVAGLVTLFLPYGPNRLPKLLGFVDKRPSPAAATPAPQPPPARR